MRAFRAASRAEGIACGKCCPCPLARLVLGQRRAHVPERVARVDVALIATLADALDVPLVPHGSSGLPDSEMHGAVRAVMPNVNISTERLCRLYARGSTRWPTGATVTVAGSAETGHGEARMHTAR